MLQHHLSIIACLTLRGEPFPEHPVIYKNEHISMHCLQGRSMDGVPASHNPVLQEVLDLRPYINSSAAAVQESFSLERTYVVFRTLGLRHLVIIDQHNHVKGMVTRKVWYDCQFLHPVPTLWHGPTCAYKVARLICLSRHKQYRLTERWLHMQSRQA